MKWVHAGVYNQETRFEGLGVTMSAGSTRETDTGSAELTPTVIA